MPIPMSLLDNTQLALQSAMSGSMIRQQLLANNLANADTPGYQPEDVNFQQTLASAMADGKSPNFRAVHALHRCSGHQHRRQRLLIPMSPMPRSLRTACSIRT